MEIPVMKKERQASFEADEEYATSGPLASIDDTPTARIIDQCLIVGKMEQTIGMLAELTNLSYKTVASVVRNLIGKDIMVESRKIGNAKTYCFLVENHLSSFVEAAQKMQIELFITLLRRG